MRVNATSVPSTLSLGNPADLSDRQVKALEKHVKAGVTSNQEFTLKNVPQGTQAITRMQQGLIPEIKKCIDDRFKDMKSSPLIQAMRIVNHTTWDHTDTNYGKTQISTIAEHYTESLAEQNFNIDKCFAQWKQLQKIARRKYSSVKNKLLFWQKIFENDSEELSDILLIAELCLSIAVAQGTVERGFSLVRRIMIDSRTRLTNSSLDDLMVLRYNVPILQKVFGDIYLDQLLAKSVCQYTEIRRCAPGTDVKRRRRCKLPTPKKTKSSVGSSLPTTSTPKSDSLSSSPSDTSDDDGDLHVPSATNESLSEMSDSSCGCDNLCGFSDTDSE